MFSIGNDVVMSCVKIHRRAFILHHIMSDDVIQPSMSDARPPPYRHPCHALPWHKTWPSRCTTTFAVILLNTPMSTAYHHLWQQGNIGTARDMTAEDSCDAPATRRLCADGGANRLQDVEQRCMAEADGPCAWAPPDRIVGDLDSLQPDVAAQYATTGTTLRRVADQDTTDLEKAIDDMLADELPYDGVFVVGATTGRFDHVLSAMDTLYRYPQTRLYLLGDERIGPDACIRNLTTLLPPVRRWERES